MGAEQVEHTCKGRTCSRDMLSLLVSSHRSHYKESPGDRMVSSTEHPRGAPIRNIPFVQREGEAQAPRVIPSDVPRWEPQGWKGSRNEASSAESGGGDQGCAGTGAAGRVPHTQGERLCDVMLSPEDHQPLAHSPWPVPPPGAGDATGMEQWVLLAVWRVANIRDLRDWQDQKAQGTFPRMLSDVGMALGIIAS